MVACADDHALSRSGIRRAGNREERDEEEDPSTMIATDPDVAPLPIQEEDWPTAEGYTPLGDMMSLGSVLVAMPPSSAEDDEDDEGNGSYFSAGSNAFVSDPNALFASAAFPGEEDNDEEHDNLRNTTESSAANNASTNENVNNDFRQVADNALLALESEYQATLSMPSLANAASIPLFESATATDASTNDTNNFANFDAFPVTTQPTVAQTKKLPTIDTAAVEKAMLGINASGLGQKLKKLQEDTAINKKAEKGLRHQHSVIPPLPLKAFRKDTPKAIQATANLTRAATIAECLHRLSYLLQSQDTLSIHIVGADPVECQSTERIRALFSPLARWVNANIYAPRHLAVCLVGPNVPASIASSNPINLLQASSTEYPRLQSAQAYCYEVSYHEWLQEPQDSSSDSTSGKPDLIVCFNAGIWGYEEWKPTIRDLLERRLRVPFVVTSYTMEEAEDDFDVMEEMVSCQKKMEGTADDPNGAATVRNKQRGCLWGPEANAFASKRKRETATAVEGRDYRENNAWQCWRL